MRGLTNKQKNLLTKWHKENKLNEFEDLSIEQIKILMKIKETEDLYKDINRFLQERFGVKKNKNRRL